MIPITAECWLSILDFFDCSFYRIGNQLFRQIEIIQGPLYSNIFQWKKKWEFGIRQLTISFWNTKMAFEKIMKTKNIPVKLPKDVMEQHFKKIITRRVTNLNTETKSHDFFYKLDTYNPFHISMTVTIWMTLVKSDRVILRILKFKLWNVSAAFSDRKFREW